MGRPLLADLMVAQDVRRHDGLKAEAEKNNLGEHIEFGSG